jgi:hypothetical protein
MPTGNSNLFAYLSSIQWDKVVAWFACVYGVVLSAKCADKWLTESPRLFTICALFALHWAIILPYYSSAPPSEILPACGGFLGVYIGVLLRRAAKERCPELPFSDKYVQIKEHMARNLVVRQGRNLV